MSPQRRRWLGAAGSLAAWAALPLRAHESGASVGTDTGTDTADKAVPSGDWPLLLPPGWDARQVAAPLGLDDMDDGDPRAAEALQRLRALWDAAPANPAAAGRRVRLGGYMVPLEQQAGQILSFLLMPSPSLAACVHEPGPPANQLVRVVPRRPLAAAARGTSAVKVDGVLAVARSTSPYGVAAYALQADEVRPIG